MLSVEQASLQYRLRACAGLNCQTKLLRRSLRPTGWLPGADLPHRRESGDRLLLGECFDHDFAGSDFSKGGNHFFVVGFDQRTRALEQLLGAARPNQD